MAESPWQKVDIRLRAVIGGTEYMDCTAWNATFEMNNIPSGSLMLAVGRNIQTLQAATIHRTVGQLRIKIPAKVYLKITPTGGAAGVANEFTGIEFLCFDGYAVSSGWTRNRGEAQFVIHLLHWLDDLNASSMLSATSHPSNPADFTFGAVFPALGPNSGGGEDPAQTEPTWTATADATKTISDTQLSEDLWKQVLHPWLMTIAEQDRLDINPLGGAGVSRGLNDRAKKALDRMSGAAAGCAVTPLGMDLTGANGEAVANGVRNWLQRESFGTWVHTTFWGKIVGEWGPAFMFSIVPRIEDAFPIPFTGPLREAFKTITPNDYDYANILTPMPQVLQAVGIVHPVQMYTGADMDPAAFPVGYSQLCGWYTPQDEPEGMLLFKEPPGWISEVIPESDYSRKSTGAEGEVIGHAADPGVGADNDKLNPAAAVKGVAQTALMDRFAQHWYCLESIKGRQGELSGKLRFDIAPGSSIKIIPAKEKFIGEDDLSLPRFATVTRVSFMINAEAQQCGTSFGLAHVRTEAENESDKTSVARPPLYNAGWPGCALSSRF